MQSQRSLLVKGRNCVARTFFHCTIRSWRRKAKKCVSWQCASSGTQDVYFPFALSLLFSRPMFRDFSVKRYIGTFMAFPCALLLPMGLRTDVSVLQTDRTTAADRHLVQWLFTQAGCHVHFQRIPLQFKRAKECMCFAHFSGHCFTSSFPLH